jgi:hypothetical protein
LVMYSVYMWNLSSVLRCGPFLWCLNICIVLWMVLNEWLCSMRCWANFDAWLLVQNACLCSMNLTVKFLFGLTHICFVTYGAYKSVYS